MIELLTLVVLLEEKCTIYKIKQNIENKYGFFLNISFGSIYPAVKRLEENKYISVKKSISSGGQRSSLYSITNSGKDYFVDLMSEELPDNPLIASQLINIKIMSINKINKEQKDSVKKTITNYLELKKIYSRNLILSTPDIFSDIELKYINYNIQKQTELVEWIKAKL